MSIDEKFLPAKESIEVLIGAFAMQKAIASALSDGKINIWDTPKFIGIFGKIADAINGIAKTKEELADEVTRQLIVDYFILEFNVDNDIVEARIEKTVQWLEDTYELVMEWIENNNEVIAE